MTPIQTLQNELLELERNLEKSTKSYENNCIRGSLHKLHRTNLEPQIKEYKEAIEKLTK